MLRIPGLLYEGTGSTIDHEDEWRWPWFVVFASGVAFGGIDDVFVAKVGAGVEEGLGDGSAVGWTAEEGFAVIVASIFEKIFGDL